jgi:hypothetical protein
MYVEGSVHGIQQKQAKKHHSGIKQSTYGVAMTSDARRVSNMAHVIGNPNKQHQIGNCAHRRPSIQLIFNTINTYHVHAACGVNGYISYENVPRPLS